MSNLPSPENVRPPQNLSDASLRQALDELDSKIRTLQNRAHATTAGATHTYHEHIASLEAKRHKLQERLGLARENNTATAANDSERSTWDEIWRGIENLREDLRNII
ncbi:sll1863 family stress response protein [Hymenobacter psychrotolerans]|uniref:Uncharacterized protein n=1 Tax=Hymenobacter psychrotolerans DSM 18569 TaxID=1121959 RepID=A0A1M6VYH5_9BACT|nr:hypothetical protein [Hymenobacter psychrotolerans]SHK86474.1 hypothetical protein SAMN02746009_01691 [Hymenobacter psychrotolerans DSM 18569]